MWVHLLLQMYLTWRFVSSVAHGDELSWTDLVKENISPVYDLDHDEISGMRATDEQEHAHQQHQASG